MSFRAMDELMARLPLDLPSDLIENCQYYSFFLSKYYMELRICSI